MRLFLEIGLIFTGIVNIVLFRWYRETSANATAREQTLLKERQGDLREIQWAHDILDGYGAPRQTHDPYGGSYELNLAGRIQYWLNPKNEPGWKITRWRIAEDSEKSSSSGEAGS